MKETPQDPSPDVPPVKPEGEVLLTVRSAEWGDGVGVNLNGAPLALYYERDGKCYKPDIKAEPTDQAGVYRFVKPSEIGEPDRWWAVAPYSKRLYGVNSAGSAMTLRLGPVQFPEASSWDPHSDYLISKPFTIADGKGEVEAFKRMFAPLCLSVRGLPEDAKIYNLTLSLSQQPSKYAALTGFYYLLLSDTYEQTKVSNVDQSSMGNAVSVAYSEGLADKNGSWPVWLMVNPITIKGEGSLTVSLSTQEMTYTRTMEMPSTLVLDPESVNVIDFDMSAPGTSARISVTQDFTSQTLGGTKVLTASNGSSLEWVTTTPREFNDSDDGGSGIKGALMLNGDSFTFPTIDGMRIIGARVFAHPCSRSRSDIDVSLTVDGTDRYSFNLASQQSSESLAWSGGVVDINLPEGKTSLSGLVVTAPAQLHLISSITLFTARDSYTPTPEDLAVDRSLFHLLDLDYPPFADIRSLYETGRYKMAADALLAYYKARPGIVNPEVTLPVASVADAVQNEALSALPSNGYRFAVHSGQYYESYADGRYLYYSFADGHGGINWEYEMPNSGTQCFQKHWHNWFLPMAKMFRFTGDESWFENWKAQYSDWMGRYPCPPTETTYTRSYGYNSWYPLSLATRIESQAQLFEYFISAEGFDFQWLTTFLKAFHETVEYSRAHLYYEEGSNIRFAQYKSHCLAGVLFPEFKKAVQWMSEGATTVSNYFNTAFATDGVLVELDANYHSGEVMNFIKVYQAYQQNGKNGYLASNYLDKLYNACRFLADYCYPDGRWECFNDTRLQTANVTRQWMETLSALYPYDNKFLYLATRGTSGTKPTESLCEYRTSGYYMFHSDWSTAGMMLIYKNNYNPNNMWHAQRDNGTVGLCRNGRIFLPDTGSYTYGDGEGGSLDRARTEHQATRNHNTLTCELANIGTGNSKGRYLASSSSGTLSYVVAENDSYEGLTHRRTVWMVNRSFYVIADAAYGTCSGKTLNLSWHLCRDNAGSMGADVVEIEDDLAHYAYGAYTRFTNGNNLLVKTFSETQDGFSGQNGLSWCSENFGTRYQRKFYRVNVTKASASTPVRFITVLYPCATPTAVSLSASFMGDFSTNGEAVKVTVNGTTYNLSYSL